MPAAILFDCDGVLVDSEVLAYEVETLMLAERGLDFERDDYLTRFMGLSYASFHAAMDDEARRRLGRPLSEEFRDQLAVRLRQTMIARLTEVSGARAAIASIARPKAVASSSTGEGLERKLRQTGLWEQFAPHVYSAEHVSRAKPAPDLFLYAAEALKVAPKDCLVIEDSVNGVKAARAAGMQVWGFLGGGHAGKSLGARLTGAGASRLAASWPDLARLLGSAAPL